MPVIVIVGLARAGKDTAADYIAKKYGYSKYTFSSVLNEMLKERGDKPTKEKMIKLGDQLRQSLGMDALAKMLEKNIPQTDNILLVGPRSAEEVEYFRQKFPALKVLKISAGEEQRYSRKSDIDPQEKEEFFGRDEKDLISKGFQKALDLAQTEIKNTSTEKKLHAEIDKFMKTVSSL